MDLRKFINEEFSRFIKEGVNSSLESLVYQAIEKGVRVTFDYPSSKTGGVESRMAFIYNYGLTKTGKPAIRVYQLNDSGTGSKWKLFALENMSNLKLHARFKIRTLPADVPSFREDGDKGLPTIYAMLDIDKIKGISSVKAPQKTVNVTGEKPNIQPRPEPTPEPQVEPQSEPKIEPQKNNKKIPTM